MYWRGAFRPAFNVVAAVALTLSAASAATPSFVPPAAAQDDCRTFLETGKSVCGKFLAYWQEHGGLAQQGYPISEPFQERSEVDGKTYTVQYFERAVFELHPENQPPHDILLSLLGSLYYAQKYPEGAPGQRPNNSPGSALFAGTSKRVGGEFLKYWQEHGGLAQQGYPISDEFMEKSDLDGREHRVQYFERAVFEYHPEKQPPYDVLLSQLGTFQYTRKYAASAGGQASAPVVTPVPDVYAELRQRPLKTPPIAPGTPCPVSQGSRADSKFGWDVRYGSGPIYLYTSSEDRAPGSIGEDGTVELRYLGHREGSGAYMLKSPWIGDPAYVGRSLVRGHQLDGPGVVRFDYAWGSNRDEMRLEEANNIYTPDGWYFWNTGTLFPGPGCYALQVDGQHFTDVIVLQVVK